MRPHKNWIPIALILVPVLVTLGAAGARAVDPLGPSVTHEDLMLAEAATLPRYYIAQGATGSGASLSDPAPMGELIFDGSDRAVVIVGESDIRTRLHISFTARPERFALLHASALHEGYPENQFRRGSVRVDTLAWSRLRAPEFDDIFRADVTLIVKDMITAYTDGTQGYPFTIASMGVMYNDEPSFVAPQWDDSIAIVAASVSRGNTGVELVPPGLHDTIAEALLDDAHAGTSLLVASTDGIWKLYLKPRIGDIPGSPTGPRLDMLLTDSRGQNNELIEINSSQSPEGNFPQRFLSYGVNLAHLSAGADGARGWRGFLCQGGADSNVRFERFMDWICGSQDVRGSLNIAGAGSKLSFVDASAVRPGTDEGHKLHANVNAADGIPVGLDVSRNWLVSSPTLRCLDGRNATGVVFNKSTVHAQSHQGYDDGYVVERARFVAGDFLETGPFASPFTVDRIPDNPLIPERYPGVIRSVFVRNHEAISRNYLFDRVVHAVTDAWFTDGVEFNRMTVPIAGGATYFRNSVIALAPTATNINGFDREVDLITIDGRAFSNALEPDRVDIVLDGCLLIAKENRRDGDYDARFHLINVLSEVTDPFEADLIRVWTRNCVLVTDAPELRLVANQSGTPVTFLTFDGQPGLDLWISPSERSPGTGAVPKVILTDGLGATMSRAQFEAIHGTLPNYAQPTGVPLPALIGRPSFPITIPQDAPLRTTLGTGPAPDPAALGLASGVHPDLGAASFESVPRYGPFGFGDVVDFSLYCSRDINGDSAIDIEDLYAITQNPIDINGDGVADQRDVDCLANWLRRSERIQMRTERGR